MVNKIYFEIDNNTSSISKRVLFHIFILINFWHFLVVLVIQWIFYFIFLYFLFFLSFNYFPFIFYHLHLHFSCILQELNNFFFFFILNIILYRLNLIFLIYSLVLKPNISIYKKESLLSLNNDTHPITFIYTRETKSQVAVCYTWVASMHGLQDPTVVACLWRVHGEACGGFHCPYLC